MAMVSGGMLLNKKNDKMKTLILQKRKGSNILICQS